MSQLKVIQPPAINHTVNFGKGCRPLVHCHGCFDMLHIGHIRHLRAAKKLGNTLVVTVTSDKYVNKGTGRPIFTAIERVEALCALQCVDYVLVSDAPNITDMIGTIRPDIYAKGKDYEGMNFEDFDAVRALGGKVVFTDTPKFSTTELIEKLKKC